MSHSFLPAAEAEYLEAVRFFEEQRTGLGGIRRIGLRQFPYAVFYRVLPGGQPQVTAFAHHRRRPGYWLKRIGV